MQSIVSIESGRPEFTNPKVLIRDPTTNVRAQRLPKASRCNEGLEVIPKPCAYDNSKSAKPIAAGMAWTKRIFRLAVAAP
jgi:hypothetical protein